MGDRDEERAWIEQSRNGDPAAFEPLVRRYQRMIHALTYRMTGSLEDAEDLAQEVFVQAFQQLGSYRDHARFSSWLYRIAVNRSLNWQKREQRRERMRQQWRDEPPEATPNPPDDLRSAQIQAALLKLPAKQRAAVALTVYDDLDHAEAARALGCSPATLAWRLFAARAKLKRLLKRLP